MKTKTFVLPDIGGEIAKIENQKLEPKEEAALKEILFQDFGVKGERHTISMNQLFKAYAPFLKRTLNHVVMESKVMIVDEQTGRICWMARKIFLMGCTKR